MDMQKTTLVLCLLAASLLGSFGLEYPLDNIGTIDDCYKGMSDVSTPDRLLITVPGFGEALCDTTTDEGGWVVFQRRTNGRETFHRNWADYKTGFGNVSAGDDYWLGLEAIHELTSQSCLPTELRVDMEYDDERLFHADGNRNGTKFYAVYSSFHVGNETTNYTLSVGGFTGNVNDVLAYNNGMQFTTYDADNDKNSILYCAADYSGGWWYNDYCSAVNLNGWYLSSWAFGGIHWGDLDMMSFTEMKLRFTN